MHPASGPFPIPPCRRHRQGQPDRHAPDQTGGPTPRSPGGTTCTPPPMAVRICPLAPAIARPGRPRRVTPAWSHHAGPPDRRASPATAGTPRRHVAGAAARNAARGPVPHGPDLQPVTVLPRHFRSRRSFSTRHPPGSPSPGERRVARTGLPEKRRSANRPQPPSRLAVRTAVCRRAMRPGHAGAPGSHAPNMTASIRKHLADNPSGGNQPAVEMHSDRSQNTRYRR
jgi:hypothetical protein